MTDTAETTPSATLTEQNHDGDDDDDDDDWSIWAQKFKITSIKSDPWRWNKDWEKVLHSLSSRDVYPMMGGMYLKASWDPADLTQHAEGLEERVGRFQSTILVKVWDSMQESRHFVTAWPLLEEAERKRHLLNGMKEACQSAFLREDTRSLCPEITVSSMLIQRGQAFVHFIDAFTKGKKELGDATPYCFPSEWWDKTLDDVPQSVLEKFVEPTFTLLTLHRNYFICKPPLILRMHGQNL